MEENVALDSSKQKEFIKSIKGIKKILKVKDTANIKKDKVNNVQAGKIKKPKRKERGLVYLSHIPHGFYEHQMTEYFKQFGVVTNARVIRSKRTGMSKGHAFVEFRDPNVAEIVAETMNNYLMGKRLIKASVIPPEKQRRFAKRKHWNAQNNPGNDLRLKMKKAHNSVKDEKEELQIARKLISNLHKTKKRLRELDIDYDFFTPVDIPEPLLNLVEVKKEDAVKTDVIKKENKLKNKVKEEENAQNNNKKNKTKKVNDAQVSTTPTQADSSAPKKSKKSKEIQQSSDTGNLVKATKEKNKNPKEKAENNVAKETKDMKQGKKDETKSKASEMQKQKEKKLKDAGVKPPNFIQIQKESDDESDSSVNFDSDEYDEVMKQGDSDVQSDDESDEELDEDITSEEDASDEAESPPPKKVEKPSKAKALATAATRNQQQGKKLRGEANKPPPQLITRMSQNTKPSKKPKFEKKGNKKTINKVIKKKK